METILFTDMQADFGNSLEKKFRKMLKKSGFFETINEGEIVALKVHVGEQGNLGYINPNFARIVVEEVKARGGSPFLTDTNTLYSGGRHNGIKHCETAVQHGFTYATVGAPFIPADGVRGLDYREVEVAGRHFEKAKLAGGILQAEKVIFLTHFKGHIEAGFGGSIKNLSMGCASVAGKMEQHAAAKPEVDVEKCVGCRQCYWACPVDAITMENKKAVIDYETCIGCGQCVAACNYGAMNPGSSADTREFIEKVTEYAYAAQDYFGSNAFYINLAVNITPDCDCWPANDVPVVEDVGFLAGSNPFALDRATMDLANRSRPNTSSRHYEKLSEGRNEDLFGIVWEDVPVGATFDYLQTQFGVELGYQLRTIK
jgi:hypothetical protein